MSDEHSTAPGGWCAPSGLVHHVGLDPDAVWVLPAIKARRGGITYPQPGTPEWERVQAQQRADEAVGAQIRRRITDAVAAQDEAISDALREALARRQIVEVHPAPAQPYHWRTGWGPYRFIGISLREPRRPTEPLGIHWLPPRDATWDDDD